MADGRHLRKEQNRHAVVDALVALFEDGEYAPTAADIAARAGISPRSLFRYFDDVDDLVRAAIERQLAAIAPFRTIDCRPEAPTTTKITALVTTRVRMHEAVAATARAGRLFAHRHDVIAARLDDVRRGLRDQIAVLFERELRTAGPHALPAIDALCSFESYELLRTVHGQSRPKVNRTLEAAVAALLSQED